MNDFALFRAHRPSNILDLIKNSVVIRRLQICYPPAIALPIALISLAMQHRAFRGNISRSRRETTLGIRTS